jgi:hypothetical protein
MASFDFRVSIAKATKGQLRSSRPFRDITLRHAAMRERILTPSQLTPVRMLPAYSIAWELTANGSAEIILAVCFDIGGSSMSLFLLRLFEETCVSNGNP